MKPSQQEKQEEAEQQEKEVLALYYPILGGALLLPLNLVRGASEEPTVQ